MKRALYGLVLGCLLLLAALALLPSRQADAQVSSKRMVTVLSSTARTTTTVSSDLINLDEAQNIRGGYIVLDVTGALTSPLITPSVQFKDAASGNYRDLLVATSGVSTNGTYVYLVYPGAGSAGAGVTQVAEFPLPQEWRVRIAHDDTDPITYTVGAMLAP